MQAPETATSVKIVPLEQQTQVLVCIARGNGVGYDPPCLYLLSYVWRCAHASCERVLSS